MLRDLTFNGGTNIEISCFKPPHCIQACTANLLNMEDIVCKTTNSRRVWIVVYVLHSVTSHHWVSSWQTPWWLIYLFRDGQCYYTSLALATGLLCREVRESKKNNRSKKDLVNKDDSCSICGAFGWWILHAACEAPGAGGSGGPLLPASPPDHTATPPDQPRAHMTHKWVHPFVLNFLLSLLGRWDLSSWLSVLHATRFVHIVRKLWVSSLHSFSKHRVKH